MLTTYLGFAIVIIIIVFLFVYSDQTFNIYLLLYVIGAISVIAGGTITSVNSGKSIAAGLFFIGALAIFVIFGLKWFSPGSVFAKTPVSWPPTINTCPDYLVQYVRNTPSGPENCCIDLIGISKKGEGVLKVFPKEALNDSTKVPINNISYFSLKTDSSDATAKKQELCKRAIDAGLTWEGITNGESCTIPSGNGIAPDGTIIPAGCPKL